MKAIKPFQFSQEIHGVSVKPMTESGREVKIRYKGLLAESGASGVLMHFGFGEQEGWKKVDSKQMEKTFDGWEAIVAMEDSQLNFCFRDIAQNWDNNNGLNWIYRIS
ncbi:MAG: hypothetical protein JL50_15670 [Peptococcaceae bacterium BICA1-7]|nr:MAG: hypothetical protein JL50_15670 [Peptococcaceae bacterium BICA1-7]HBV96772.1 hypothetical protein [Desulfotomaculum sp.]